MYEEELAVFAQICVHYPVGIWSAMSWRCRLARRDFRPSTSGSWQLPATAWLLPGEIQSFQDMLMFWYVTASYVTTKAWLDRLSTST